MVSLRINKYTKWCCKTPCHMLCVVSGMARKYGIGYISSTDLIQGSS